MKLTELNESLLSEQEITDLIFNGIDYTGETATTALVLGTNTDAASRAIGAAALYRDGRVKKLIPTGMPLWDFPDGHLSEADYIKVVCVREGVTSEDVICENQATDTYENMTYSLEIIQKDPSLVEGGKLMIVTSGYHMQRSVRLAQHVFPDLKIIPCPIYEPEVRPENWMKSERGQRRVRSELHFLIRHAQRGIVKDEI